MGDSGRGVGGSERVFTSSKEYRAEKNKEIETINKRQRLCGKFSGEVRPRKRKMGRVHYVIWRLT